MNSSNNRWEILPLVEKRTDGTEYCRQYTARRDDGYVVNFQSHTHRLGDGGYHCSVARGGCHLAASTVMPYDGRLDAAVPGTRTDFSQRALRHFCEHVPADGNIDAVQSAEAVRSSLTGHTAPTRPVLRERCGRPVLHARAGGKGSRRRVVRRFRGRIGHRQRRCRGRSRRAWRVPNRTGR